MEHCRVECGEVHHTDPDLAPEPPVGQWWLQLCSGRQEYTSLSQEYTSLSQEYTSLSQEYTSLSQEYTSLRQTQKSLETCRRVIKQESSG